MERTNRLYKELILRVGSDQMQGINKLLDNGHTGIAERHAVEKLVLYTRDLEQQLGINLPEVRKEKEVAGTIKVNNGDQAYYL